jgi:lipid II:glycine glycyltransferase (peptidoglycan interpeptide bridge formation enzyme)
VENQGFIQEIKEADHAVCENADTFLQSAMWGEFKSCFGWERKAFLINWKGRENVPLLAISRVLALGFSFVYIPWGPQLPLDFPQEEKPKAIFELAVKLRAFFKRRYVFIRFDPPWYGENGAAFSDDDNALYLSAGFKKSGVSIQPPDTVIINLSDPTEKILKAMKIKWKYNISLAQKKGVIVKIGGAEKLEIFYKLLKETAARDGILVHNFEYYKTLFEKCSQYGITLRLYTASHEDETIAAIVVLFYGKFATYLYGASSGNKRNLMPSYALQWKAMQDAKEAGCRYYDLFGIPPDSDPNHPMAGLYLFKTGFGGQIIHRPGSWDYPYKPFVYGLFNTAESMRKKIRNLRKRRIAKKPQSNV